MRLRFGAEFPFIRDLSISDLELKHHLSAEPVNFRTLLSVVTSIARHLQTTIFGTISCTGLVVNFRFPLTYGLPCFLPITVSSFLPQVMVVNFQILSPYGIVALLETTKPSRRKSSTARCFFRSVGTAFRQSHLFQLYGYISFSRRCYVGSSELGCDFQT